MTYLETVAWMFSKLPMYQRQGIVAYKKDLTHTLQLSAHLNFPEKKFKSIHVAGTNGKGSTSHILASVLQEAGYKVGLYTSPHLKDFRERIKINGKKVNKHFVIHFIEKNKVFLEKHQLSFFEMTVGMAFDYFSKQKVDIAIIETGLGGRMDSTNIILPEISVITNISLDHTQVLGNSLQEIAAEKAGIIKANTPVIIGEKQDETTAVFQETAKNRHASLYFAEDFKLPEYPTDLKGSYQSKNSKTALATLHILKKQGWKINAAHSASGLLHVVKNTGLLGRWQTIRDVPKAVCDTAHNAGGIAYVFDQIKKEKFEKLHIVFGVVNDKALDGILSLLPKKATYYFCKPNVPRGLEADELKAQAETCGLLGKCYNSVQEAYQVALQSAGKNDFIFIGGSTFVVAEII
ncbi:MAG TPA: folylpolyglutamate synthase/dihydrofolate synthase family protein [Flavobacteriaceae bacterium]|nr:folylpolyglutamate synthase/dihydrofolate synthase family protein [Flavobacteriaceae bacterium]